MSLLAVESSCDETSVAVIEHGCVLANIVSSQIKLHEEYGGVVPELATREHLRNLLPLAQTALKEAGRRVEQLTAVAATQGPGLPNALLIGFLFGESLAYSLGLPFVGVHHHEAHLYSPWIQGDPPRADFENFQPNVSLIVSGGHTLLVYVSQPLIHRVLGGTLDDAAGECFDKTAKLLGLPYPGGPQMDRLAGEGSPTAYKFPRPLLHEENDDFSFAGLKTSVRYFLQKNPELAANPQSLRNVCASVQAAIVEVLVVKTIRAAKRLGVRCVTASGGVTCNRGLRAALEKACKQARLQLRLADKGLCTDNAAMIGILAEQKLARGFAVTEWDAAIHPGWELS